MSSRPGRIALLALLVSAAAPLQAETPSPFVLNSLSVDLPDDGQTFPGPDAEAINDNCLGCHSAGMVLNQPALTRRQWAAEVDKMRNAYKAPVPADQVDAIVAYLARTKGKD
jgi:hypothetical protein